MFALLATALIGNAWQMGPCTFVSAWESPACTCERCNCEHCRCSEDRHATVTNRRTVTVLCPSFHCPGCEQAKTWLLDNGIEYSVSVDDSLDHWPQFDVDGQRIDSQSELRQKMGAAVVAAPRETPLVSRRVYRSYPSVRYVGDGFSFGSCSSGSCR